MWDFLMFLMGLSIWDWAFYILSSTGIVLGTILFFQLVVRFGVWNLQRIEDYKPLLKEQDKK